MQQLPLPGTMPPSDWRPPLLGDLPSWKDAKRIAIDLETCDKHIKELGPGVRRGAYIIGFAFAIEDGPSYYLPVRHSGDNCPDEGKVWEYVRDQMRNFSGVITGANLGYELDYLGEYDIPILDQHEWRDTQVAAPILNEYQMRFGLAYLAELYGMPGKDETMLKEAAKYYGVDPKGGMKEIPARYVGAYGEQDVRLPLDVLRRQEKELEYEGLWDIYKLECALTPVLINMRRRGLRIDLDALEQVEHRALREEKDALSEIEHLSGVAIRSDELLKTGPLSKVLDAVGATYPMTPKTGKPSIKAGYLAAMDHPIGAAIRRARQWRKLREVDAAGIRKHAIGDRIHGTLNQLRKDKDTNDGSGGKVAQGGTVSGRLSGSDPNLQNQNARHPVISKLWRAVFCPEAGEMWCTSDFSQQEPRLVVHFADACGLPGASEAARRYREDPTTDFHSMMAEMSGLPRKDAKAVFLARCYGQGGASFCRALGLPTDHKMIRGAMREVAGPEGQEVLDTLDQKVPFIRLLAKEAERTAAGRGYIWTLLRRKCRFPRAANGSFDWTHKALNRLAQGSAADQTKLALLEAERAGFEPRLQVHDEIDCSVTSWARANELGELMENVIDLKTGSRCDVECGPNWGNISAQDK